jgi:hypothetical protein
MSGTGQTTGRSYASNADSRNDRTQHYRRKEAVTIYTYDTEFLEDGSTINLISIGIVCEDGREYYAVNSDADWDRIREDEWLVKNVVAHLPLRGDSQPEEPLSGSKRWFFNLDRKSVLIKPKWLIANEVREFLLSRPGGTGAGEWQPNPELWAYYAAYDHVALAQLYGKMISLPRGFPMWTHDLMQQLEQMPPGFAKPEQDSNEHNALADARWNMLLLKAMRKQ